MSAALAHPIGPNTVDDWLAHDPPQDGSRLELFLGYFSLVPPPGGKHQYVSGDLREVVKAALRRAGRTDLYAVEGVGVEISTSWRTGLIPDIVVVNIPPYETVFQPEHLALAVEIWSPGNPRGERETKKAAYAGAGVPFFWTVDFGKLGVATLVAYRLEDGVYVEDVTAKSGALTTILAAPVPITLDPGTLLP